MANVYDVSKIACHPQKLQEFKEGEISAPLYVRIKPTNRCNHSCIYCSYAPGNDCPVSETINMKDEIPKEKILEILEDFQDIGVKAITYSGGGEPLIYPAIIEVMKKTLDFGIDLSIITNGQKLNEGRADLLANAKWVRVSASESDAASFQEVRRRPQSWFYDLSENLYHFSKKKNSSCELGINFVVHKGNFQKIFSSARHFKELGVNHIKITPAYSFDFETYHSQIKESSLEQISRARQDLSSGDFVVYDTYENDFNLTGRDKRTYPKCFIMQTVPVIGADSVVYFCHDKTYTHSGIIGEIKRTSFKELWFSERAKKTFSSFDPTIGCRHHCTYDARNLLIGKMLKDMSNLEKYKPPTNKHINFI